MAEILNFSYPFLSNLSDFELDFYDKSLNFETKFIFRVIFTILDIFEIRDFGILPDLRGFSSEDLDEMLNQAGESATNLAGKKGKWSRSGFNGQFGPSKVLRC